ncbi:hypothetical protein IBX38_05780 [Candidatus Bathyarchaeota archaeon]|nr:hypothetical protein [Candidatus Bathyarchaeota archaeon]
MRSAFTKLRSTRIVDLTIVAMIIVAIAIGGYNYYFVTLHPPLKKAEFQVTNLTVYPAEAGVGQPILISVNVTNVGEEEGNYSVKLTINGMVKDTKTVQLLGNESRIVEFLVTEINEGSYSVKIGGLNGTFIITDVPPPSTFIVSDLNISPYEAWANETIKISVKVSNIGNETLSYPLAFRVNDVVKETKTIQLSAGENTTVETAVTESSEGTHSVIAGGLTGTFKIVPTGKHTLTVAASGAGALSFTLDGVSYSTPYSELLDVGRHTITVPVDVETETAVFKFMYWSDGVTSSTRTIDLQGRMILVAQYQLISGYASCPSLFVWNGISYVYAGDVSSRGYLGYLNYLKEDGWPVFWRNYPWDYIKLDRSQLRPRNGYYDLIITERYDEIFYLDAAYVLVVDHPSDVNVYTTMGEQYIDPKFMGKIYTVSKNPLTPISAVNEKGEDVLPQISKLDGIFTTAHNGIYSPSWDNIEWNRLELNLGDLSNAKEIKLLVNGILDWGPDEDQGKWYDRFWAQPVPNGTQPIPPPYMEVKDARGTWVRVPESRQFPMLPDAKPRTIVVDLTGLFPTNDYSLRINNFWEVPFDYIGVDITPQKDVIIQRIDPANVYLYQAFYTNSTSTGNFTRYGDVTPLVLNADDKFVIGRQGDKVALKFPANIAPPPENMERDFFLYVSLWFKEEGNPSVEFTVDPLPFYDMSAYPYLPTESYPYDEDHLKYLREYNTREIAPAS